MTQIALWRRLLAEYVGSALLAAVVIGSGIAAQQLSPGQTGLQLFENAAATAAGLFALILMFGPVSGAHFNPVVSFVDAAFGGLSWRQAAAYLPAQVAGCISGAILANAMFGLAAVSISTKDRASGPHFLSEIVATAGLMLVIFALARSGRAHLAAAAVGAYIGAAYWFTSSTSFANPAITVGPHVLQHLCRYRPLIGAQLRGRPDRRRAGRGRADPAVLPGRHPGRGGHRRGPPPLPSPRSATRKPTARPDRPMRPPPTPPTGRDRHFHPSER